MRDVISREGLQKEWHVESAAIEGWHSGCLPDERALKVLARHNITYHSCARIVNSDDFFKFDYIFAMDRSNLAALKRIAPSYSTAKMFLLGDFGLKPDERIIEDPYYVSVKIIFVFLSNLIYFFRIWEKSLLKRYISSALWLAKAF